MWGGPHPGRCLPRTRAAPPPRPNSVVDIPSTLLASAGPRSITVQNLVTVASPASTYTVNGPTLTSLSPNSAVAGSLTNSATLTLTVTGTNFVAGSAVYWNSTPLNTHPGSVPSATQLMVDITSAQLATSGPGSVTVQNTGTAVTSARTFTVNGPTISALSSYTATATDSTFTLTVTGTNFVNGVSKVWWGTEMAPLATIYVSPTELTATVTSATELATATTVATPSITVQNGAATATSNSETFTVAPTPTLTGVTVTGTPATATHNKAVALSLAGTNFVNGSTVMFGATPVATTYVNANSLTASVSAAQNPTANAALSITVVAPGGATTAAKTLDVH